MNSGVEFRVVVSEDDGSQVRGVSFQSEDAACDYALMIKRRHIGLSAVVERRIVNYGPWLTYERNL